MPSQVWYEPEVELEGRLVGHTETFELREPRLGAPLLLRGENSAILGAY